MRSLSRLLLPIALIAAFLCIGAPLASAQDAGTGTEPEVQATPSSDAPPRKTAAWEDSVNETMSSVNHYIEGVFFFPIPIPWTKAKDPTTIPFSGDDRATKDRNEGGEFTQVCVPFAVLWLVLGAIFFTLRMGFVQLRLVGHALQVVRGKYDEGGHSENEVSHFQALSAALSATVGLGNIAGVAIAISIGGPGATFWMIVAGLLGMASKFTECTLGQMYRQQRSDGSVMGGAMYYLSNGLKDKGLGGLGRVLAILFAILCIGGSLAGGNSFQVNQSLGAIKEVVPFFGDYPWAYGIIMTVAVGVVILGGLQRIADVASKVVPAMCAIYVAACLFVILSNVGQVGAAFGTIVDGAFRPSAALGGIVGVLVVGFQRAAFSNEAGVGSAAIAHSAASTKYPVREGIVALLEPMIDTVIICTMTALVIVISGAYVPEIDGVKTSFEPFISSKNGAGLTSEAFKQSISWFPYVLGVAVALFAFSTMISWSYYGERCFAWLFGDGMGLVYKALFLSFTFLGSIVTGTAALEFGDLMILGMAIPNVLGVVILSGKVKEALNEYQAKRQAGEF